MKYTDFPLRTYDKLRYRDTDKQGHVNNANFSTFFETGRTELLYLHEGGPIHDEDSSFVIARIELDYISEIKWPGTVEIGTLVKRIGNSSIGLFEPLMTKSHEILRYKSLTAFNLLS
ncbi:acyl-CoA thioesterase [Acidaminobacter sp. JC074]|uniref:acyl-CoA thioesterase n=1 Tax=Acidaminobacter sp. JC074 TaxID=2530199 RepID=UPI001F0E398C|nr:thioesterase family protein [Acidaminobacter sp. JC074]MCH4890940.1 acyl-CoA thioesterase [Acidaminobacter sp. JC074]